MDTNTSKYVYFVPSKFLEFAETINQFLHSNEPGIVLSPPKNGTPLRVEQLIQDYQYLFDRRLVQINLGPDCEEIEKIKSLLVAKGLELGSTPLYLLITNADYCLSSKNMSVINELVHLQYATENVRAVYFFESNIMSDDFVQFFSQIRLFSQIYYQKLYDLDDAERFLYYSAKEWEMEKPPKVVIKKITFLCNGQLWLLRHALREYRFDQKLDFENLIYLPGMQFRLDQIAKSFSKEEINVLLGGGNKNTLDFQYLNKLGLLKQDRCIIPILEQYLVSLKKPITLRINNGEIFCNDVNLKHSFTLQEHELVKCFLSKPGLLVTRDEIASVIWGEAAQEKYSLWAIEQLIKRLRLKFGEIGLSKQSVKTVRGQGYIFTS